MIPALFNVSYIELIFHGVYYIRENVFAYYLLPLSIIFTQIAYVFNYRKIKSISRRIGYLTLILILEDFVLFPQLIVDYKEKNWLMV